ncbi:antitoxin component YwqK of YwqJK toxin-antitoxin module [Nocardiopsis arvandica]|uniref:Antitoxin component YwqK of YwqJK toxin-antitoxin module n=1 Tax=Nocardiopsis sinuspersici TaxID=501010 RepID=A0A7Y9XCI0_9ACTN|nr:hypothetical protein [Nocardiopsis sinuspersici]NYH52018.1 antitoxin component YwqK of YwqJK toxin-antitoxin module [Nocardiopsis sinuspersici]
MQRINSEELGFLDEITARFPGHSFTGQSVERDGEYTQFQTFVRGYAIGPSFLADQKGKLLEYSNCVGNIPIGPYFFWSKNGSIAEERVDDFSDGSVRLIRKWDEQGRLTHEDKNPPRKPIVDISSGEAKFRSWQYVPPHPDAPGSKGHVQAVRLSDLDFGGQVTLEDFPYTGEAILLKASGATQLQTFVEGSEDGPFLIWAPSGKLILQGLRQSPHGPVGPWHEWDEEGRLLRETIYDALGNRIIARELDEHCNIVKQEKFAPTRLLTNPETGGEHPAPWL